MTRLPDFAATEELLLASDFDEIRPVWYSSNYVYLAQLCHPGGESFTAVYKPQRGEAPLWDFPNGTLHRREAAAYRLSQLLGWEFIPPTVVRKGPQGVGSLQLYVEHDPNRHFFEQRDIPALIPQLQRMAAFDVVANNADRKGGHCLLDSCGRGWGIDHGLRLSDQYKLRTVIWDWADEPVPDGWLRDIACAFESLSSASARALPLLDLLEPGESQALRERIRALLSSGRFPRPGPHRSYPWPLV